MSAAPAGMCSPAGKQVKKMHRQRGVTLLAKWLVCLAATYMTPQPHMMATQQKPRFQTSFHSTYCSEGRGVALLSIPCRASITCSTKIRPASCHNTSHTAALITCQGPCPSPNATSAAHGWRQGPWPPYRHCSQSEHGQGCH